jgi:hypothetical protein
MKKKFYKPAVAFGNQANAEKNIFLKLSLIENMLLEARKSPTFASRLEKNQASYPRSLRQFNLWDSVKGPSYEYLQSAPVTRNSNETLRRYPLARVKIEAAIAGLKDLQIEPTSERKSNAEKKLSDQLKQSELFRRTLELELIVAIKDREKMTNERDMLLDKVALLQRHLREATGEPRLVKVHFSPKKRS